MKRALSICACLALAAACTTIKIDHGDTNTIQHTGDAAKAQELVDRACHRSGSGRGEIVSTVNKDPSLPEGTGTQVTTFRCTTSKSVNQGP
ncbi:hypothetical protein [Povalibacter sp.]|uniref:hypothetical protein n=1 Tax=Povalibacter sp. TaxID=1962978 RepID=UPI002F423391